MELKIFFEELENQLVDAVEYNDFNIALKAISKTEKFLEENKNNINSSEEEKLKEVLISFKWVAFANLDDSECEDLILKHMDVPTKILPLDLEDLMTRKLSTIFLEDQRTDLMERFYLAMEKSSVMFGKKQITVGGRKVEPTLANWLYDFKNFPSKNNIRTSLDEVNYFNQSSNYSILDTEEKQNLQNIISLYDSLKNPVLNFRALPETTEESIAFKDFNLLEWLPGLEPAKESIARTNESSYSLTTQEFKLPTKREEFKVVKSEIFEQQPTVKKVDVQEILNRGAGVRIGNQQDIINSKLEAGEQGGKKENVGNTPPSLSLSPQGRGGETLRKVPPVVPVKPQMPTNKITTSPVPTSRDTLSSKGEGKEEDLLQIRAEIERKKQMAQAQIDKRLESLKNRKANN